MQIVFVAIVLIGLVPVAAAVFPGVATGYRALIAYLVLTALLLMLQFGVGWFVPVAYSVFAYLSVPLTILYSLSGPILVWRLLMIACIMGACVILARTSGRTRWLLVPVLATVTAFGPVWAQTYLWHDQMERAAIKHGITCVRWRSVREIVVTATTGSPLHNRFHATGFRDGEPFNWSFTSGSWDPVPRDNRWYRKLKMANASDGCPSRLED